MLSPDFKIIIIVSNVVFFHVIYTLQRRVQDTNTANDVQAPVLDMPYKAPCEPTHKDAKSALKRVKSESCKRAILKTACLAESKKLYKVKIKRLCPLPKTGKSPAKSVNDAKPFPHGPSIRIAYVMTVHGRSIRQVKRLFKAIYHSHHFFYFHVDTVSRLFKDYRLRFKH